MNGIPQILEHPEQNHTRALRTGHPTTSHTTKQSKAAQPPADVTCSLERR